MVPDYRSATEVGFGGVHALSEPEVCTDARIARLRSSLSDALAERDVYAQELFETNRTVADLSAQRQALIDRERAAIDREREAIDRIAELHSSTSWRLTKPIRFGKRLLLRLLRGGRRGANS